MVVPAEGPTYTQRNRKPRILGSARKHGIPDDDIRHAVDNFILSIPDQGLHQVLVLIGPARNGVTLLEVGIIEEIEDLRIIHADDARPKYLSFIGR